MWSRKINACGRAQASGGDSARTKSGGPEIVVKIGPLSGSERTYNQSRPSALETLIYAQGIIDLYRLEVGRRVKA